MKEEIDKKDAVTFLPTKGKFKKLQGPLSKPSTSKNAVRHLNRETGKVFYMEPTDELRRILDEHEAEQPENNN